MTLSWEWKGKDAITVLPVPNKYRCSETISRMFSLHSKTYSGPIITALNKLSFLLAKALDFALQWKGQDKCNTCQHGPHNYHHLKQAWLSFSKSVFLHGIMGILPFKIHPTQLESLGRHFKKIVIIIIKKSF